jgi:hypothetical protein
MRDCTIAELDRQKPSGTHLTVESLVPDILSMRTATAADALY